VAFLPDPELLIRSYGYPMLVAGTMVEGEIALVVGGLMAAQGYLDLSLVLLCGFMGAIAGDQFFFHLGRRVGMTYVLKRRSLRDRIGRVEFYCRKYKAVILAGSRFMYGCRALLPFFFGVSSVRAGKFFLFNAVGASLWAATVGLTGYFVGHLAKRVLSEAARPTAAVVVPALCAAACVSAFLRLRGKKK